MGANLISLERAQCIVAEHVRALPVEAVALDRADGRILAEDVRSDMDYPPFDKAMMHGFAVRTADFADGSARLRIIDEVAAGDPGSGNQVCTPGMSHLPLPGPSFYRNVARFQSRN